jgi:hypothetical protein
MELHGVEQNTSVPFQPPAASQQLQKLIYHQTGMANQGPQRADGQLFVLRNREIDPHSRLAHHNVAPDLAYVFHPAF